MKIWIDNTGLHGAGRCLAGEARLNQDLRGHLQMATLLVFSDSMSFGGFESEAVGVASQQYRDHIVSLGLPQRSLDTRHVTRDEYSAACKEAARLGAGEWSDHFTRSAIENISASFDFPKGVPTAASDIQDIIQSGEFSSSDEGGQLLTARRAAGALEYMLRISGPLRRAVAQTISQHEVWSQAESYKLEAFLRSILNDQLAQLGGDTYAPAVSRAEQLTHEQRVIARQVDKSLKEMMSHVELQSPLVPRVSLALLRKARGDPAGIINEALEMRERAKWPRAYLGQRLSQLRRDPTAPDEEFRTKAEFERYAKVALGLEKKTRLIDAVDLKFDVLGLILLFAIGLPPVSLSGGKLADWVMQSIWKRRLVVLTDLARASPFEEVDEVHLKTFVEKATGRSFPDAELSLGGLRAQSL